MLDDDTNVTSDTLGDMNTVSHYFKSFKTRLLAQEFASFAQVLAFFSRDFELAIASEPRFMQKLALCIVNLQAINELVDKNTDKSENTIKTISRCLSQGTIVWTKIGERFDFKIKVRNVDQQLGSTQEEAKEIQTRQRGATLMHQVRE